jgi:hypothetical protein
MPSTHRLQFTRSILAEPHVVWSHLTDPNSYRQWTSAFAEGSRFEGAWESGAAIRFLGSAPRITLKCCISALNSFHRIRFEDSMFRSILLAALVAGVPCAKATEPTPFKVCPFTPAELQMALGVPFSEGQPSPPLNAGTLVMPSCQYQSKRYSLRVQSQVYQNPADAKKAVMPMAGRMVPITNDPDGAVFQEGQGDLTDPSVHYSRGKVAINLRVMGGYYKDAASKNAEMLALRDKLAKLRRVP